MLEFINISAVPPDKAEWMVLPFYQPCERDLQKFRLAVEREKAKESGMRPLWILVHDWSKCNTFRWSISDLRDKGWDKNEFPLQNALVTNGDSNTHCYQQRTDIVIPPEYALPDPLVSLVYFVLSSSCFTPKTSVVAHNIKPVLDRSITAFFAGNVWGTGTSLRLRVICLLELHDHTLGTGTCVLTS